jgi:nucleoside-diphosphate-sugar epimerase
MKILILGGTGAMGKHLVSLLNKNNIIFVTSRNKMENEGNITYIQGDAKDLNFLNSLLDEKWDAIVDFMVYTTDVFSERIEKLLHATKQYVFISSARVYSASEGYIKENSPRLLDVIEDEKYLSTDEYALTKARQENILREAKLNNWTVIRPYITYSETRLQLGVLEKEDWLYRALKGRTIVFSKDLVTKLTTLTYGLDVSKAISKIIGKEEALANEFHITNRQSIYWKEVLNIYLDVLENSLGHRPKVLLQDLPEFFKHHPAKYQVIYDRLHNRQFDNDKISKFINHDQFIDIERGLKNCLIEFLNKPIFNYIDWRKEAIRDRAAGEFTKFTEIKKTKDILRYFKFRFLKTK